MKFLSSLALVLFSLLLQSYTNLLWAISPVVDFSIFSTPDESNYVETYLLIPSSSVTFATDKDSLQFQAKIGVTILFKQGEKIVQYDKYTLNSPIVAAKEQFTFDVSDLKRYALPAGDYEVELSFKDLHKENNNAQITKSLTISPPSQSISLSDIVLVSSFEQTQAKDVYVKNGLKILPNVAKYYPASTDKLTFYVETYHTDKLVEHDKFLLVYSIKRKGSERIIREILKVKRQATAPVAVLLAHLDISQLSSGNYEVVVEVRNKKNERIVEKRTAFQRNKPKEDIVYEGVDVSRTFVENIDAKKLLFYLKALQPLASVGEQNTLRNLRKGTHPKLVKQFIYDFWAKRDEDDPEAAFLAYKEKIDITDNLYKSAPFEGFETDRGRVFLRYGQPNDKVIGNREATTVPYEIWHYYVVENPTAAIPRQTNVQFVFYNPNIGDQEYKLIHSTALNEINDNLWKKKIMYIANDGDFDNTEVDPTGRNRKSNLEFLDDF